MNVMLPLFYRLILYLEEGFLSVRDFEMIKL